MEKTALRTIRLLFAALLIFEFLNWIGALHFEVKFTWLGLIITGGGVYGFLEFLNYYLKKHHQAGIHWVAFLLGLIPVVFDVAGDMFYFYNYWWYDISAHFLGSAAAAGIIFAFFKILRRTNFVNWYLGTRIFFAFTTAVALGVLFELEEFGEDLLTCYHRDLIPFIADKLLPCGQRFGDAYDTGADLFYNVLGGLAAVLIAFGWSLHRRSLEAKKN